MQRLSHIVLNINVLPNNPECSTTKCCAAFFIRKNKELDETNSPKETAAWDYSRAFGLLSAGYLAEYLTREQALNMSLELAKKVQPLYHSWDEFFEGYFKGYEEWSEKSSELRRKTYQLIKNYDNSPYNLPWNLELKKDW